MYLSLDRAENWTNISNDFPGIPALSVAITDPSLTTIKQIYVGTDLGVYLSFGQKYNWISFNGNLPNAEVPEIYHSSPDNTIRIATFGRGAWKVTPLSFSDTSLSLDSETFEGTTFQGTIGNITATDLVINSGSSSKSTEVTFAAGGTVSFDGTLSVEKGAEFSVIVLIRFNREIAWGLFEYGM